MWDAQSSPNSPCLTAVASAFSNYLQKINYKKEESNMMYVTNYEFQKTLMYVFY